ncbi:hypothetical protein [Streptomyces sp. NPDC007346]|uniref:hypothetical protein n=1 Tax=Streptomyces sp. NPDC007346 TaxID=3154682 RepID=UPI003455CE24
MADELHVRYMGAHRVWAEHSADCGTCTTTLPGCPDGAPLWERFTRLQDAYLTHLRTRGTS